MKTLVIAGASSMIARETVRAIQSRGEQINIIAYSRQDPQLADADVSWIPWDVTEDFPGLPDGIDTIDAMFYAPGTINLKPFKSIKPELFQQDMQVNFFGVLPLLQAALPLMKNGGGDVLFISSVAAGTGMAYHASIAAAKSAVEGFVRAMAAEYAAMDIRFNALALSLTDTPLASRLLSSEDKRKAMAERHPLNRVGDPSQVGAMAAHILSGEYSWMTGEVINLDGGIGNLR
jgi:3-oxoacyl-[acyl-carrier protein] reductase